MSSALAGSNYGTDVSLHADTSPSITVAVGDKYLVTVLCYAGSGAVRPTLSKASGTATIGVPVLRNNAAKVTGLGASLEITMWEIPVTGAGTCSIGLSAAGNESESWGLVVGRGLPTALILAPGGTNGNGTAYSAPALVFPAGTTDAFAWGAFTDDTGSNLTYAFSDTQDWQFHDGTSGVTGGQNHALITTPTSKVMSLTASQTQNWQGLAVGYGDSAGGADVDVAVGVGAAMATGAAISVATSNDVHVSLGLGVAVAAGFAPSITTTADQFVSLGVGAAVAAGLAPTITNAPVRTFYRTTFPNTEALLSEGGNWINGQTPGVQWGDFETTGHKALGLRAKDVADNTALLTGQWPADQYAIATAYVGSPSDTYYPELELRLRSAIATNVNRGYEIGFSLRSTGAYLIIVRWNGAYNDYTYIRLYNDDAYRLVDGDVIQAEIRGHALRVYKNGVLLLPDGGTDTVADLTKDGAGTFVGDLWTDGAPGIGTNAQSGGDAFVDEYGFTSFEAGAVGPVSVTLGAGAATAQGLAPTIAVTHDVFIGLGGGAVVAAGLQLATSASADVDVSLGAGAAAAAGQSIAIAVTHDVFVALAVGAAAAAGLAPMIATTADVFVTLAIGQAIAAGLNPSVNSGADVFVDVGVGLATATGLALTPHITADVDVSLGASGAVATGLAPTLHVSLDVAVQLAAGAAVAAGLAPTVFPGADVVIAIAVGRATAAGGRITISGTTIVFVGTAGRLVLQPDDGRLSLAPDNGRLSLIPDGMTTTDPTQTRKAGDALILGGVMTGEIPDVIDWTGVVGKLHIVTNADVPQIERNVLCTITPPISDALPRYDYIGEPILEGDYLYEVELTFDGLDDPLTWPNDKTKFKLKVVAELG